MQQIIENTQTLQKLLPQLNEAIDTAYQSKNPQAWKDALQKRSDTYNKLAFPGGLKEGIEKLENKDPEIVDITIEWLKADPYYFRSGYHKKKIVHLLKHIELTNKQTQALQEVLINAIYSKQFFYREYSRLARKIQDKMFQQKIENIVAQSQSEKEIRRAKQMLSLMQS